MKKFMPFLLALPLIVLSAFLGYFLTVNIASAHHDDDGWTDTSSCSASECGTTNGTKTQAKYEEVCNYDCPVVEFSTSREVCPEGYDSHDETCRKWVGVWFWGHWEYADKVTENFSVSVPYGDKSADQNHCHKPTPQSLDIPHWARGDYGKLATELDTIESNCHQETVDTRTVTCDNAEVIECQPTATPIPTPSPEPTCEWVAESGCSAECGGGVQDWYHRGEGCDNAYEQRACNEQPCLPATPPCQEPDCEWVAESACSKECGGGVQDWYHRGEGCDNAYEQRACNEQSCEDEPTPTEGAEPTPTEAVEQPRGGTSDASAPVCNDIVPEAPSILSLVSTGANSFKLTWTKVTRANSYSILYGRDTGDYLYSVFSTGDTDNYEINGISDGCFAVKAINGCMPGPLSAEVCSGGTGGATLGASTLGATGTFMDSFYNLILIAGTVLSGLGIKKLSPKKVI